ncbi:MAG: peptide chain release factor N(5)-glutamine methyltransferase, partial [Cellulomonas sp.]|nr:peptide chain release factor N(5)-glutamine methyltransferase [Cellulomonas sp.]
RQGDVRDPDLLADLTGRVDVVVANPPYIPPDQVPVDPEVRDHDPDLALYGGGADGLDVPRAALAAAVRLLVPRGLLVMEHAEVQAPAVRAAAQAAGLVEVRTEPDLTGRPRAVVARAVGVPAV